MIRFKISPKALVHCQIALSALLSACAYQPNKPVLEEVRSTVLIERPDSFELVKQTEPQTSATTATTPSTAWSSERNMLGTVVTLHPAPKGDLGNLPSAAPAQPEENAEAEPLLDLPLRLTPSGIDNYQPKKPSPATTTDNMDVVSEKTTTSASKIISHTPQAQPESSVTPLADQPVTPASSASYESNLWRALFVALGVTMLVLITLWACLKWFGA